LSEPQPNTSQRIKPYVPKPIDPADFSRYERAQAELRREEEKSIPPEEKLARYVRGIKQVEIHARSGVARREELEPLPLMRERRAAEADALRRIASEAQREARRRGESAKDVRFFRRLSATFGKDEARLRAKTATDAERQRIAKISDYLYEQYSLPRTPEELFAQAVALKVKRRGRKSSKSKRLTASERATLRNLHLSREDERAIGNILSRLRR
jgi:hypothetical protein